MVVSGSNPKDNIRAVGLPRRDGGTWFPVRVSGMSERRQAAGRDCRSSLLVNICLRLKAPGSEGSLLWKTGSEKMMGSLMTREGYFRGRDRAWES